MVFLLQVGLEVGGHLPESIAGGVTYARMAVLGERHDVLEHIAEQVLHLLVTALTARTDRHHGGVSTSPILRAQHRRQVRQNVR